MKTVSCNICGKTQDLSIQNELEGWFLAATQGAEDYCPEHCDQIIAHTMEAKKEFIAGLKEKYKSNVVGIVKH